MFVVFLHICGFFCTFAVQKNISIFQWNKVIIKFKAHSSKFLAMPSGKAERKVLVALNLQHATFQTSSRCQPG